MEIEFIILPGSVTIRDNGEAAITSCSKICEVQRQSYEPEWTIQDLINTVEKNSMELFSIAMVGGRIRLPEVKLIVLRKLKVYLFVSKSNEIVVSRKSGHISSLITNSIGSYDETAVDFQLPLVARMTLNTINDRYKFFRTAYQCSIRILIYSIIHHSPYKENFDRIITFCGSNETFPFREKKFHISLVMFLSLISDQNRKECCKPFCRFLSKFEDYNNCVDVKKLREYYVKINDIHEISDNNFKDIFASVIEDSFGLKLDRNMPSFLNTEVTSNNDDLFINTRIDSYNKTLKIVKALGNILSKKIDEDSHLSVLSQIGSSVKILILLFVLSPLALLYSMLCLFITLLLFTFISCCGTETIKDWLSDKVFRLRFFKFHAYVIASASLIITYPPIYNLFLYHYFYAKNTNVYREQNIHASMRGNTT
jgi:hypothetical protein